MVKSRTTVQTNHKLQTIGYVQITNLKAEYQLENRQLNKTRATQMQPFVGFYPCNLSPNMKSNMTNQSYVSIQAC